MAHRYARAGAQVILLDHDETAIQRIARLRADHIKHLKLDVMDPEQSGRFAEIWEDEPLHTLVHLQPLRYQTRPAGSVRAVVRLNALLLPALKRAGGKSLILFETLPHNAPQELRAFNPALAGLAPLIDSVPHSGTGGCCGLHLMAPRSEVNLRRMARLALWLTAPGSPALKGAVLRLGASDD